MSGRTQVFEASSAYQVLVLAAAIDAGLFGDADRRILLASANGAVPEASAPILDDPVVRRLAGRFTATASYNELIAPLHPKGFRPRPDEQPLFQRAFRRDLGIPADDAIEIALESVHVPPARTLMTVFSDAAATVYAEGLMSYGPTRDPLTIWMTGRIERVLHLDLVPGLVPALLAEYDVPAVVIPDEAFRTVVAEVSGEPRPGPRHALVLGQYLADLGLLSPKAEAAMYADLVGVAAAQGFDRVVFKPHPSAPGRYREELERRAAAAGVALEVDTRSVPVETLYAADPPGLVLGCFSTGLVTARFWGVPAVSIGTGRMLAALPRFEDSNRVPVVIVDRTVPRAVDGRVEPAIDVPAGGRLARVLDVVGYAMQPRAHAARRDDVMRELARPDSAAASYVPQSRRRRLLLPGGFPVALGRRGFEQAERVAHRIDLARGVVGRLRRSAGAKG